MYEPFGLIKVATLTPPVQIGNPLANAVTIREAIRQLPADTDIIVTPELSITGYTCGDLFGQPALVTAAWQAVLHLAATLDSSQLLIVGCPVPVNGCLYNCAVVINESYVVGVVPKSYLSNYKEFYEGRHFQPVTGKEPATIFLSQEGSHDAMLRPIAFGTDLLFQYQELVVGIEICEDLWVPLPPSSFAAVAGANVLINLSASNEVIGKTAYRRKLVEQQSARCIAAYLYCSSGPTESSSDIIFGGHNLIYENGTCLHEAARFDRQLHYEVATVDIQRLNSERRRNLSFGSCRRQLPGQYRIENFSLQATALPDTFVAEAKVFAADDSRCEDIFAMQTTALRQRLETLRGSHQPTVVVGVSGGLDSTLALLVCAKTYDDMGLSREHIHGVTLPSFGTSSKTLGLAKTLMEVLGVYQETVDIRPLTIAALDALEHQPFDLNLSKMDRADLLNHMQQQLRQLPADSEDLVFENVQARLRTLLLMSKGLVIGTGDLSELAVGYCTYNGDHMSMYNVNCSIPKTLMRTLVDWLARSRSRLLAQGEFAHIQRLRDCLWEIGKLNSSPELLPSEQISEGNVGPYELVDFFLFHLLRSGHSPAKIAYLARHASGFTQNYTAADIDKWLAVFLRRFFANQFKRNCVPDGPKIGSVALSPRGDWRLPADALTTLWSLPW